MNKHKFKYLNYATSRPLNFKDKYIIFKLKILAYRC